jgi:hypothetical protein
MSELRMVKQRRGRRDTAPWILEGGRRRPGMDDHRRLAELRSGLTCHSGVRAAPADASGEAVESTLGRLHEPSYLEALDGIRSDEPVVMPHLAAPGLEPDIPVCAGLVASAREGVRTAISAAARINGGARFAYALSRPPRSPSARAASSRSASSTSTCTTRTAPRRSSPRWMTPGCTRCTPIRSPTSPTRR